MFFIWRESMVSNAFLILASLTLIAKDLATSDDIDARVQRVLSAKTSSENLESYKALFGNVTLSQIPRLKHQPNVSIGIRAAWEEFMRNSWFKGNADPQRVRDNLNYFVGFIEGRLNCRTPEWWKATLLSANFTSPKNIRFVLPRKPLANLRSCGIMRITTKDLGGPFVLEDGINRIVVGSATVSQMHTNQFLTYLIDHQNAYLAWHMDAAGSYYIYRLDLTSHKIDWRAKVWADGGHVFYSGVGNHIVSLAKDNTRLLVFGASESCVYVEEFDEKDGSQVYRFSTGY
jgi:hypothetical protein